MVVNIWDAWPDSAALYARFLGGVQRQQRFTIYSTGRLAAITSSPHFAPSITEGQLDSMELDKGLSSVCTSLRNTTY
jgi:hypothetical protein